MMPEPGILPYFYEYFRQHPFLSQLNFGRLFIMQVVANSTQLGEDVEDIMAGADALARKRAELLQRGSFPMEEDLVLALSLFCWWPFKPEFYSGSRDQLLRSRWRIFQGAAKDPERITDIVSRVADDFLKLSASQIFYALERQPISKLIRLA